MGLKLGCEWTCLRDLSESVEPHRKSMCLTSNPPSHPGVDTFLPFMGQENVIAGSDEHDLDIDTEDPSSSVIHGKIQARKHLHPPHYMGLFIFS